MRYNLFDKDATKTNSDLIFRLAEHAAWKQCRSRLFAGESFTEVSAEIERNIRRERRRNKTASGQFVVDGWKAGLEHARQDAVRLMNTASAAKQLELL